MKKKKKKKKKEEEELNKLKEEKEWLEKEKIKELNKLKKEEEENERIRYEHLKEIEKREKEIELKEKRNKEKLEKLKKETEKYERKNKELQERLKRENEYLERRKIEEDEILKRQLIEDEKRREKELKEIIKKREEEEKLKKKKEEEKKYKNKKTEKNNFIGKINNSNIEDAESLSIIEKNSEEEDEKIINTEDKNEILNEENNIKDNNIKDNNIKDNNVEDNNIEDNNIEDNNIEDNNIKDNNIENKKEESLEIEEISEEEISTKKKKDSIKFKSKTSFKKIENIIEEEEQELNDNKENNDIESKNDSREEIETNKKKYEKIIEKYSNKELNKIDDIVDNIYNCKKEEPKINNIKDYFLISNFKDNEKKLSERIENFNENIIKKDNEQNLNKRKYNFLSKYFFKGIINLNEEFLIFSHKNEEWIKNMNHEEEMESIYEKKKIQNLSEIDEQTLENQIFEENEIENDNFNQIIGNLENFETFLYKYSLYSNYELMLKLQKNNFHFWRNILNDGDSFYRSFMFSLIENYILESNITDLEMLISEIFSSKINNIYKSQNLDTKLIKGILKLILSYSKKNKIKEAYHLFLKAYKLKNKIFDKAMIIYLRNIIYSYLLDLTKYPVLNYLLSYFEGIKEFGIEPIFTVICLLPYLFRVNVKIIVVEGTLNNFKNHIINLSGDSENYPLIIIGYFFSGYHVVYLNNINKNNDIIKEEIKKNKNNNKKLTFILKEKEICKICNTETNQIMFLKKKFICCQKCLNEFMDSIIDKRLKFFEEDSYFGIEYYSRRIKLQNQFYIDNDEIIELYNENVLTKMINKIIYTCNQCKENKKHETELLECGCRYCQKCLHKKIKNSTQNKMYINIYEQNTFAKIRCCCNNDFKPIEAIKHIHPFKNESKDLSDKKKDAKIRMENYIKTLCMICCKKLANYNKDNKNGTLTNLEQYKNIQILKEKNTGGGLLCCDKQHIMCLKCYANKTIIFEKDENDDDYIETQGVEDEDINNKKNINNEKVKGKIKCNICDMFHFINDNDLLRNDMCCGGCYIF